MKGFIGVKNGKIWDICSDLRNKRDDSIPNEDYIDVESTNDMSIDDTWDNSGKTNIPDAPRRTAPRVKSAQELKIEELEAKIIDQELRLRNLEGI